LTQNLKLTNWTKEMILTMTESFLDGQTQMTAIKSLTWSKLEKMMFTTESTPIQES